MIGNTADPSPGHHPDRIITMKKYQTWAIGLPPEDIEAASSFAARQKFSVKHRRRVHECMAMAPPAPATTASKSQAGPLDVFPGEVLSGAELYRQSYPHALELRRQLVAAMRGGKKLS
jgi:hypothetical protein